MKEIKKEINKPMKKERGRAKEASIRRNYERMERGKKERDAKN
jgi:hypothetical protein